MRSKNGSSKVVIELRVVQFWSEIIVVISNRTRAALSFDFEIRRMISDQIALHSDQLPLFITLDMLPSTVDPRQKPTLITSPCMFPNCTSG